MAVPNRGPELQAVGYVLLILAFITLTLRCYVRVFLVKSFGLDDWAMLVAMVRSSTNFRRICFLWYSRDIREESSSW
jgi:hypothetical protein